ncbi:hypothetical protein D3C79_645450 [compost metagenome]
MATGIPGEEVGVCQVQFIHQVGNAPGVFVPPVKQQHGLARFARRGVAGWPVAIEQRYAVMGGEGLILSFAHCNFLMLMGRFPLLL